MDKFDKIMQEKLQSFKPTVEEQDWLAMEEMLDNRPRKLVLLPWWKYGVAAAALIGVISVSLISLTHQKHYFVSTEIATEMTTDRALAKLSIHSNRLPNGAVSQVSHLSNLPANHSNKPPTQATHFVNYFSATQVTPYHTKALISNAALTNVEQNNNHIERNLELISLPNLSAMIISESQDDPPFHQDKIEEVSLQKEAKRLSQFAVSADLGALAKISMETKSNAKELNVYSDIFSDAGINFFATLLNRVGLYTGIKYADRKSFSRPDSLELGNNNRLLNAKSKILGINIPIGIYCNIYDQKYCSVYSKIGINNIIPLQETIRFETVDNTNSASPLIENTRNIGNTKFTATADNSVSFDTKKVAYSTNPTNTLPVKHNLHQKPNEQYLAELQLAFGLKVKATRNLAFNIEPAYLLDLKNRYRAENSSNFAFNTGISYSF